MVGYLLIADFLFLFFYLCNWEYRIDGKLLKLNNGKYATDLNMRKYAQSIVFFGSLTMAIIWPLSLLIWIGEYNSGRKLL